MKLLLLTTFVITISNVSAGKTLNMIAAMNAGMLAGMNGLNPGVMIGGLNPAMLIGGGAGLIGQPQFPQLLPGVPAFAVPRPIQNMFPVPAFNGRPFMGVPQTGPMNPPQQPLLGITGGAMSEQVPPQPDPIRRFRRQIMKQGKTITTTVDTQIPPTDTAAKTRGDEDVHHEDN